MKFKVVKDKKIRNKFRNNEARIRLLKSIYQNMYIKPEIRESSREKLSKYKGIEHKIKNRCVVTGRSFGVMRKFKVSRIEFKSLAVEGILVGVKKSSW